MTIENSLAHQSIFQIEKLGADLFGGEFRRLALGQRFDRCGLDLLDLGVTLLLLGECVYGGDEPSLRIALTAAWSSLFGSGATHDHFGLPASAASSLMALIAICICS